MRIKLRLNVQLNGAANMTINFEINEYLNNRPQRYDFTSYAAFLREVAEVKLPNAIHITGTNGKGSTARYLAKTLEKNGYKVGIFISPHFARFNELATINDIEISDEYIKAQIYKYKALFDKHALSAFEIMTYISFNYFIDEQVDYSVIEVGMGGLKDSTNVFVPILSVVTNIGLDHKLELGPTIEDIARHKAGIIKKGVPVIIGKVAENALSVFEHQAKTLNAQVILCEETPKVIASNVNETTFTCDGHTFKLASGAYFEVINACLVWHIFKYLQTLNSNLKINSYQKALLTATYSGRFSVVNEKPLIVVDGAHNPHALRVLINEVLTLKKKVYVVYATYSDKDYKQSLDILSLANIEVVLTTFKHPRALTRFSDKTFTFIRDHKIAIKQTIQKLQANDLLLVIGSLYFATLVTREFKDGVYEV